VNNSKEQAKTEVFPKDSVPELNTKKLGISPKFLCITHTTLSARRCGSYRILIIDVAAKFCFWTEQWQNISSVPSPRLAKTLKVLNTVLVENSLSFSMVHLTVPKGSRFVSYGCRKLDWLLNQHFWAYCTILNKSAFSQSFTTTSPQPLYTKNVFNKLDFLLVTHMTCFDIRFGRYEFLKSGFSADQVLDKLGIQVLG
jgi:hypothetical protein